MSTDDPDQLIRTERAWRRCVIAFVVPLYGGILVLLAAIAVIDPYDSGRFPTFMPPGTSDDSPHTLGVSRGRSPGFDAIIVGNSRGVLLDPQAMSAATGYRFLQMSMLATGPLDHIALLHWFSRHRDRVAAIVLTVDETWCRVDLARSGLDGFPAYLYGDSTLDYLRHTISKKIFQPLRERILIALNRRQPVPVGAILDIERDGSWRFSPDTRERFLEDRDQADKESDVRSLTVLDQELARIGGDPVIVMWMPPLYVLNLPEQGTAAAHSLLACKRAVAAWAASHARATFIDFATENPTTRDPANFLDGSHVRKAVMRTIAGEIAAAVNDLTQRGTR